MIGQGCIASLPVCNLASFTASGNRGVLMRKSGFRFVTVSSLFVLLSAVVASGQELTPMGGEFLVPVVTTGAQYNPAVDIATEGGFVVTWNSSHDGSGLGVFARRFGSTGQPLAGEFL